MVWVGQAWTAFPDVPLLMLLLFRVHIINSNGPVVVDATLPSSISTQCKPHVHATHHDTCGAIILIFSAKHLPNTIHATIINESEDKYECRSSTCLVLMTFICLVHGACV